MPTIVLKRERMNVLSDLLKSIETAAVLPGQKDAIREWQVLLGYTKHYTHFSVSIDETPAASPALHTENSG